jgi:hypothetical protein
MSRSGRTLGVPLGALLGTLESEAELGLQIIIIIKNDLVTFEFAFSKRLSIKYQLLGI